MLLLEIDTIENVSGAHPSRISVLSNGSSIKCLKAYLVVVDVVVVVVVVKGATTVSRRPSYCNNLPHLTCVYIVPSTLVDSRYILQYV